MTGKIMPAVPAKDTAPEWVTVQEAAELAHRDEKTIYDWISREWIASKVEFGRIMVPPKAARRLGQTTRRGRPKGRE